MWKREYTFTNLTSLFQVCKSYSGFHFLLIDQTFVIALDHSINHLFQLNRVHVILNLDDDIISVQLAQCAHKGCDILHKRFLSSLSSFFTGVLGHCCWAFLLIKIAIKINQYCSQRKEKIERKWSISIRVCRLSQRRGCGGEAAAPEKEKKSQQFVHDCILDPF